MLCTACALCHVLLAYMYFVTLNHVSRSHLLHATGLSKTSSSPPRLHPSSSLHFYYLLLYYLTLLQYLHYTQTATYTSCTCTSVDIPPTTFSRGWLAPRWLLADKLTIIHPTCKACDLYHHHRGDTVGIWLFSRQKREKHPCL